MIDPRRQIDAVSRGVIPKDDTRVLTISQVYDTGVDDLWTVVTTAERIPRWFLPVSGELKLGGHYQLTGNAGGTVTACDPPHGFAATWEYGEVVSWIEVRLTPEGDGRTRFTLDHISRVADDPMWAEYGPGAGGMGWDMGLLGLVAHLTEPDGELNPRTAEAWLAGADGKLFLKLSSAAWAEAEIAAGEDPAVARRRAGACHRAYAGES